MSIINNETTKNTLEKIIYYLLKLFIKEWFRHERAIMIN